MIQISTVIYLNNERRILDAEKLMYNYMYFFKFLW